MMMDPNILSVLTGLLYQESGTVTPVSNGGGVLQHHQNVVDASFTQTNDELNAWIFNNTESLKNKSSPHSW